MKIYKLGHMYSHWEKSDTTTIGYYKDVEKAKEELHKYIKTLPLQHEETTLSQICFSATIPNVCTSQVYIEEIEVIE
jgi:hypothetical protein